MTTSAQSKTVAIVGGGFSGALFGLKLSRARPDYRVILIEARRKIGRGIAYGACDPGHLLNVPVNRMEVGLKPGFAEWLEVRREELTDALEESGQDLMAAFAPRRLFGDYMEERVGEILTSKRGAGLTAIRGEAVRLLGSGKRGVLLTDGREIEASIIILAMGNPPPRPPGGLDSWLYDTSFFVPDPWAQDALEDLDPQEPVLLIGTGLTMVDVALRLEAKGHTGARLAISRHGLQPRSHCAGGAWPPFLQGLIPASPLALYRHIRAEVDKAAANGVPWQRVFDAARPAVASVWDSWTLRQRRQFLRHLRARWDVHRHRMAPRVGDVLEDMLRRRRLEIVAGRVGHFRETAAHIEATLKLRSGGERVFTAKRIVNCTGPGADYAKIAIPLTADLRERKVAVPDDLGLGLETDDCAVIDAMGRPSPWLFALGPLTRPTWWEITAVPEICVQIDRLVAQLAYAGTAEERGPKLTAEAFLNLGEGI